MGTGSSAIRCFQEPFRQKLAFLNFNLALKVMVISKQHIARQGKKLSRWFEPLSLSSRDFSVLFLKKLKVMFLHHQMAYGSFNS
jgi:hypothetical protein